MLNQFAKSLKICISYKLSNRYRSLGLAVLFSLSMAAILFISPVSYSQTLMLRPGEKTSTVSPPLPLLRYDKTQIPTNYGVFG